MKLIVNGTEKKTTGTDLLMFLQSLEIDLQGVVVEHNGVVLPRGTNVSLGERDRLEILHFVGGG